VSFFKTKKPVTFLFGNPALFYLSSIIETLPIKGTLFYCDYLFWGLIIFIFLTPKEENVNKINPFVRSPRVKPVKFI